MTDSKLPGDGKIEADKGNDRPKNPIISGSRIRSVRHRRLNKRVKGTLPSFKWRNSFSHALNPPLADDNNGSPREVLSREDTHRMHSDNGISLRTNEGSFDF